MNAEAIDKGITKFSQIVALILVGWFASCWHYGTGSFAKVKQIIPALQAEAGCEKWRGDQDTVVKDKCPHPKIDPTVADLGAPKR